MDLGIVWEYFSKILQNLMISMIYTETQRGHVRTFIGKPPFLMGELRKLRLSFLRLAYEEETEDTEKVW
jgi:hypothetical protein